MTKVLVKLPVALASGQGLEFIECEGETVGEALAECAAQNPRLGSWIFDERGRVWTAVVLNGRIVHADGVFDQPLGRGDVICLLPPMSCG